MPKTKNLSEPASGYGTEKKARTSQASSKASKQKEVQKSQALPDQQREMVAEISQINDNLRAATRLSAAKAIELGERLTKLKQTVGHGRWLPFVARHLPFDERTAARYMKVYASRVMLSEKFDSVTNIQVSEAYEALTRPKKPATTGTGEKTDDATDLGSDAERGKADILTEIQRRVVDRLENLPVSLLAEFESDLRTFLEGWVEAHAQEVAQ